MTAPTCQDIVTDALVWRGIVDPGVAPDDADAARAMIALKGIYQRIVKMRVLTPVQITGDYTPAENERLIDMTGGTAVITLPTTITVCEPICLPDGTSTYTRAPIDRSVVVVSGTSPKSWLYDADAGAWADVQALTLTSPAPMANGFRDGLAAALTVLLRYPGVPLDPLAVSGAQQFRSDMGARWDIQRDSLELTIF